MPLQNQKKLRRLYIVCICGILLVVLLNYILNCNFVFFPPWKNYSKVKIWNNANADVEVELLAAKRPNLPVKFWHSHRDYDLKYNETCALFPNIMKIRHIHGYWQLLETEGGNVKLLSAHLDDRMEVNTVRILTMIDQQSPLKMSLWCQFWFHDRSQPVMVSVSEYFFLWHEYWYQRKKGEFQPFLLSCNLPSDFSYGVPSSVSLVEKECDGAGNLLKVIYKKLAPVEKKGFAVCSKGINFTQDITVRLVEWIELLILLGVEKIYIYDIFTIPQVQKACNYYAQKGYLEMTPLMLPEVNVNEPFLQHMFLEHDANIQTEVIPLNHCFMQHMHEFEYIAVLDTDEIIIPKNGLTRWRDLVNRAQQRADAENVRVASFVGRNCYFFENATLSNMKSMFDFEVYEGIKATLEGLKIPEYMHMSQRVFRSTNCTGPGMYIKSIHSTKTVVAVHNHFHLKTINDTWHSYEMDIAKEGHMHHYRNGCPGEMKDVCYSDYQRSFMYDDSLLGYYYELKKRVVKTLDDLGYF